MKLGPTRNPPATHSRYLEENSPPGAQDLGDLHDLRPSAPGRQALLFVVFVWCLFIVEGKKKEKRKQKRAMLLCCLSFALFLLFCYFSCSLTSILVICSFRGYVGSGFKGDPKNHRESPRNPEVESRSPTTEDPLGGRSRPHRKKTHKKGTRCLPKTATREPAGSEKFLKTQKRRTKNGSTGNWC